MTGRSGWGALAAVLVLAGITACSGGDEDAATTTTDDTTTPPATAPAPDPSAAAPGGTQPAGVTPELVAAGETAYKSAICVACHGADATGTPNAPNLTDAEWINTDGTYEGIQTIIRTGVPTPKSYPAPMPPMGGAQLSDTQISELAAYIYSISHKG